MMRYRLVYCYKIVQNLGITPHFVMFKRGDKLK